MCADPGVEILETVGSLVDKSLVQRSAPRADVAEFVLLESLREFAAELLAEHDDLGVTRARHAAYFAELATAREAGIGLPAETQWWRESTASDQANLQAALDHCLAVGDTAAALRLAAALGWYSYFRGHLGAGQAQLHRVLAVAGAEAGSAPDDALAGALVIAGILAWTVGELDPATKLLTRGFDISDAAGDLRRTAIACSFLGHLNRAVGRHDDARARHERAAVLYREIASAPGYAWTRYDLGLLAHRQGDLDTAARCLRDGLTLFREIDYGWAIGRCAWALAVVCLRRSEVDEAAALLAEALVRHEEVSDGRGLAQCLEASAGVACARGFPDVAARLLGAAAERRERLAAPLPDDDRDAHRAAVESVRRALGPDGADRSRGAGRAMGVDAAATLARNAVADRRPTRTRRPDSRCRPAAGSPAGSARSPTSSPAGSTNRQIGRALGIAEKTVEVHVHHVIAKLGARSRAEVAAWVVTQPDRPLHGSPDTQG